MKKVFVLLSLIFLLNGCVESVALLSSTLGGASSGRIVQSSLNTAFSYGIKQQTGKTPLGHALAYAEENNPERKKETCVTFIEKSRSEFCTIAKKKISLTNKAIKEKFASVVKTKTATKSTVPLATVIEPKKDVVVIEPKKDVAVKNSNFINNFNQLKKSPRELAIVLQTELKNLKKKYLK
jgi:hypothetical protein